MNRTEIDKLIVNLLGIYNTAKDIHYSCSGPNFYGNHLLSDRIAENLNDYIDQLKEICLLGRGYEPLKSYDYLIRVVDVIPHTSDFGSIKGLMENTLLMIEKLTELSKADENLVGAIAQDIQNNLGLLNIMEGK